MTKYIVITVLLLIIVGGTAYLYGSGKLYPPTAPIPTPTTVTSPIPESTTEPTVEPSTTPITTPTPEPSAETQIRAALATKHNKPVADTQIEISDLTGNHAKGVVKFSGEIAGGWFLAVKTTGPWEVVADGNGIVMCSDIDPFNFPNTMVTECWDNVGNQLITR